MSNQTNQTKRISRCLTINTQCDWDCKYCIAETNLFSTKPPKPRPQDEVLFLNAMKFLSEVPQDKYWSITLSGGEPGLLPTSKIKEIFQLCYNRGLNIDINSNGRIFSKIIEIAYDLTVKNPEERNIKNCVNTIDWHIIPDISEVVDASNINQINTQKLLSKINIPKSFKELDQSTGDPSKQNPSPAIELSSIIKLIDKLVFYFTTKHKILVRPLIVVTKQDIPLLDIFLKNFQLQIPIEVRICEVDQSGHNKDLIVKNLDILKVYQILLNHPNTVSEESLDIINKILNKEKRNHFDSDN